MAIRVIGEIGRVAQSVGCGSSVSVSIVDERMITTPATADTAGARYASKHVSFMDRCRSVTGGVALRIDQTGNTIAAVRNGKSFDAVCAFRCQPSPVRIISVRFEAFPSVSVTLRISAAAS